MSALTFIYYVLVCYCLIFQPRIYGIPTILFLIPLVVYNYTTKRRYFKTLTNIFSKDLFVLLCLLVQSLVLSLISKDYAYIPSLFFYIFIVFPLSVVLVDVFFVNGKKKTILHLLIITGTCASFLSVMLFLFPELNVKVKALMMLEEKYLSYEIRNFAFSSSALFGYPVAQGIMVGLCLYKLKDSYWYYIPAICLLFSIVINARIGLIIAGLFFIYFLFLKKDNRTIIFLLSTIVLFVFFLSETSFYAENELIIDRLIVGYNQTFSFIQGRNDSSETVYDILLNSHIHFPPSWSEWVVGTGTYLFGDKNRPSDIGFILQLYYGGLVFFLTFMYFVLHMAHQIYKTKKLQWFSILFPLIYFISNFKGDMLRISPAPTLLIFLYVYIIYSNKIYKEV